MNPYLYLLVFVLLVLAELFYFRIADKFNIIDKPNQRSSHSTVVLRGGGIIFLIGVAVWAIISLCAGARSSEVYPWFLLAVTLAAGISFVDDIRSLPDSVRLLVQFVAMGLLIVQLYVCGKGNGMFADANLLVMSMFTLLALIVCVGATNIYNFMDGINGITAGYSLAVLVPLAIMNVRTPFMEQSLLIVSGLSLVVFSFFNFRPRGKAKCFAGDVGSVGIAFILLFAIGMLIMKTEDISWLVLLLVYGVDGVLTICHRIMLRENLGQAHRKHAYQLMANELKVPHPVVSLIYMGLQLIVSLGFVCLCPAVAKAQSLSLIAVHWIYLALSLVILSSAYVLFMKKFYHLHEEYLKSLES